MTPKALKALQSSIRKWEKIVLGTGQDRGSKNCALCAEYYARDCRGCPVFKATGRIFCRGTPYQDYTTHEDDRNCVVNADGLHHARRMLDFLRGLLPKRVAVDHFKLDSPT